MEISEDNKDAISSNIGNDVLTKRYYIARESFRPTVVSYHANHPRPTGVSYHANYPCYLIFYNPSNHSSAILVYSSKSSAPQSSRMLSQTGWHICLISS